MKFAKLKNLEEVEDFLKYDVPVEKRPFSIRVIALFNGKEGNKEDIEQFKEAAEAAAIRPDVYFALVNNLSMLFPNCYFLWLAHEQRRNKAS